MPTITAPFPHVFRYPVDGMTAMAVRYDGTIRPVFDYAENQVIIARETGRDVVLVDLATARIIVVPVKRFVAEARLVAPDAMDGRCPAAVVAREPLSLRGRRPSLPLGCEAKS